ncbi:MAG: hypothetical protein CSA50_01445 [Gammaproteobacteria bacterium]|nr:MAG: hypothetical protein CSA50_01445 [Gammaproteobacteria bacterium]
MRISLLAWLFVCLSSFFHVDLVLAEETITIKDGWVRLVPSVSRTTVAYMVIRNNSGHPDRLLSAASDIAERVVLHTTTMSDDGMMHMGHSASITIPAKGQVELGPAGTHLMLMGLTKPLVKGNKVVFDFVFERQGKVNAQFAISDGAMSSGSHVH